MVLRDQVTILSESDDLFFRPIGNSLLTDLTGFETDPMQSNYFHGVYKAVRQQIFSNSNPKVVYNGDSKHLPRGLVFFLPFFSYKTASSLIILPFITYPIHSFFLNLKL